MSKKRPATGEELHALFRAVFELHAALSAVMDEIHVQAGLRTSQCRVTSQLERRGAASVPEIAAALKVSRQYVQVTCDELKRMGAVEYRDNPRHQRSKQVAVTEMGRRIVARTARAEAVIIEKVLPDTDAGTTVAATASIRAIAERLGTVGLLSV